ncbi:hypothetical protein C4577_06395 [Candidatus Parcubacteria bacterium]|nr:MAG: hypothetical protein C4577_06395 [Candidatus Parcubacteria bacterium]
MEDMNNLVENLQKDVPVVTFGLDQEFDTDKIYMFLKRKEHRAGAPFQQEILHKHPQLKGVETLPDKEMEAKIKEYVEGVYQKDGGILEPLIPQVNNEWGKYAPIFFAEVGKLFKGLPWPPGLYRGLLSISQPYPRYLDCKLFQIPISSRGDSWLKVTAHEMLHFIFYEYVRQRYTPQLPNTIEEEMNRLLSGKFSFPLWELSEIFNGVMLISDRFGNGGYKTPSTYPDLVGHLETIKFTWEETNEDIDLFFSKLQV